MRVAVAPPPPPPPPTFAEEAERVRFSPTAVKALLRLADAWNLTGGEAAALLGISATTWDRMRAGTWRGALSQDQLTRASAPPVWAWVTARAAPSASPPPPACATSPPAWKPSATPRWW